MTNEELEVAILGILYKASIINGINIPDKEAMPILIEELILQFRNRYGFVNTDEVLFALRNYRANDWGKNFNLNYLDEIIQQYLYHRSEVSKLEESKPVQIEYKPEPLTDEQKLNDINEYVKNFHGSFVFTPTYMFLLPLYLYDYLLDLNLIEEKNDEWFMEKAIAYRIDQINEETMIVRNNQNPYYRLMLKKSFRDKDFPEHEKVKIENIYKKLIILDYIKNASKR